MIAFVTLFLGLVTGQQVVEVAVSGPVVTVELRLDGELVRTVSGEPWKTSTSVFVKWCAGWTGRRSRHGCSVTTRRDSSSSETSH